MRSVVALVLLALAGPALAGPDIMPLDREAARRLVDPASQPKPAIVALWSTECSHCKKNLDLYARMARADKRLRLITVAAEPLSDRIAAPLDRLQVPGLRYAYGDDAPEALAYALDSKWYGELPRTLFFDGRGGVTAVSGVVDEAAVRRHLGLVREPR